MRLRKKSGIEKIRNDKKLGKSFNEQFNVNEALFPSDLWFVSILILRMLRHNELWMLIEWNEIFCESLGELNTLHRQLKCWRWPIACSTLPICFNQFKKLDHRLQNGRRNAARIIDFLLFHDFLSFTWKLNCIFFPSIRFVRSTTCTHCCLRGVFHNRYRKEESSSANSPSIFVVSVQFSQSFAIFLAFRSPATTFQYHHYCLKLLFGFSDEEK